MADDPELDRMQRVVDATRAYIAAVNHVNEALEELRVAAADYIDAPDDDHQQTLREEWR